MILHYAEALHHTQVFKCSTYILLVPFITMVKYRKYRQVLCIQFRVLIQEKTDIAASTVNVHLVKISRTLLQFLQHNLNFNFFSLEKLEKKILEIYFQTCLGFSKIKLHFY